MAQLTDLEKVRSRRARRKLVRNLLVLAAFGVVVFGAAYFMQRMGQTDLKSAVGDIRAEIQTGTGYPVPLPGGKILATDLFNNALVLVTDSNLCTFNDTGRKMADQQHGLAAPAVSIAGDRMLLYDLGAAKIESYSRTARNWEMTVPFPVYDVDLSKNGNFAVASDSDRALAQVSVYNSEQKNIFNWLSADRPVISVSLADSKEAMAVGCIDVLGGNYSSRISRFQLSMDKEMGYADLPGELLLSVNYRSGSNVYALTDKRAVMFGNDLTEENSYAFNDSKLLRFQYGEDGRLLLLLQKQGGTQESMAVVLSPNLKMESSFSIEGQIKGMTFDNKYLYVTDKEKVTIYEEDGTPVAVIPLSGIQFAVPINGVLYYGVGAQIMAAEVKQLVEAKSGLTAEKNSSQGSSSEEKKASSEDLEKPGDEKGESSMQEENSSKINADSSDANADSSGKKEESSGKMEGSSELQEGTPGEKEDSSSAEAPSNREENSTLKKGSQKTE